ncbi:MAG: ECF transporter S component [Coriobacteriales bacterium]|jgi:riboflavin transporter FmnP|nr:ECF transporter S component [Coriobacteriales bacterium]
MSTPSKVQKSVETSEPVAVAVADGGAAAGGAGGRAGGAGGAGGGAAAGGANGAAAGSGAAGRQRWGTRQLASMAVLLAISVILSLVPNFPLMPVVDFIKYEYSDLPILIATFAFGTPAGLLLAALTILLNFMFGGAESGYYGMIMHFLAIGSYVVAAGLIYRVKKDIKGAIIALIAGVVAMTIVMIPANLIVTPLFMGGEPIREFVQSVLGLIVAANLLKGLITAVLVFLLYKRLSPILHGRTA